MFQCGIELYRERVHVGDVRRVHVQAARGIGRVVLEQVLTDRIRHQAGGGDARARLPDLRGGRHVDDVRRGDVQALPFVVTEEERLVPLDRGAEGGAVLRTLQR